MKNSTEGFKTFTNKRKSINTHSMQNKVIEEHYKHSFPNKYQSGFPQILFQANDRRLLQEFFQTNAREGSKGLFLKQVP